MNRIILNTTYAVGTLVYLIADTNIKGHILGIVINDIDNSDYCYKIRFGTEDIDEYSDFEITDTRDYTSSEWITMKITQREVMKMVRKKFPRNSLIILDKKRKAKRQRIKKIDQEHE